MILSVIYGEVTEPPSLTASARCHLAAFVLLFTRDDVCEGEVTVRAWRKGRGGGGALKLRRITPQKELELLQHLQDADSGSD